MRSHRVGGYRMSLCVYVYVRNLNVVGCGFFGGEGKWGRGMRRLAGLNYSLDVQHVCFLFLISHDLHQSSINPRACPKYEQRRSTGRSFSWESVTLSFLVYLNSFSVTAVREMFPWGLAALYTR